MDVDIGVKIVLSILFCGLPSAIGRSDRKMEKLLKKNEGKTVVVVKKKKYGIIMTILKGIFNLVIGYIATPYLCFQYVMTIVRTQKEIKSLQGGECKESRPQLRSMRLQRPKPERRLTPSL